MAKVSRDPQEVDSILGAESIAVKEALSALEALLAAVPEGVVLDPNATRHQLQRLRKRIVTVMERLDSLLQEADPVKLPAFIFDPADSAVVGELIANTLLLQPRVPLGALSEFYGSGVYAIYYNGSFDAYQPLVGSETPIYVGKADPKLTHATTASQQGRTLRGRLSDHAKTIKAAENLKLDDFEARYLVVRSAWQGTAEHYLINLFRPIWNKETKICFGFGKHGDKATTRKNARSPWDTLHSGRKWAAGPENVENKLTIAQIKDRIAKHFQAVPARQKI
jgi:hypothetical protein